MAETLSRWVEHREEIGGIFFSLDDVCTAFPQQSRQVVENGLQRLRTKGRVYSPYRGFYVILPASYRLRRAVPPMFYMDDLMSQLKRRYYFSLLSASALWGAAHQRAQVDFVTIEGPKLFSACRARRDVVWISRKEIPEALLIRKSGEVGDILYSNAELTAVELVQFEQHVGGLSAVATVLRELLECTDFGRSAEMVFRACKETAVQRLGYLVDRVLHDEAQGEIIYREWRRLCPSPHYVRLNTKSAEPIRHVDDKWKIAVNETVEEDEQ